MKISTKIPDSKTSGIFITFSHADSEQILVKIERETPLRRKVNISLPKQKKTKWLSLVQAVIRRISSGFYQTFRFDYDNVLQFFSIEELQMLDRVNAEVSFHIHGAPSHVAERTTSTLDVDQISRNVRKQKYTESRKQYLQNRSGQPAAKV